MNNKCESCISGMANRCLSAIDPNAVLEINKNRILQRYKKGKIIFSEGNYSNGVYCVKSGKVKLTKSCQSGKDSILQIVSSGHLIGHHSFFNDSPHFTSAVALEEVEVWYLPEDFITKAIVEHPSFASHVIRQLSHEMLDSEVKLNSILKKSVRERLAHLLVLLSTSHGTRIENRLKLEVKLSRDEIAGMIGTVNETVTRFITEFKIEGLIEEEGRSIYIIDHDKLREFANLDTY